MRIEHSILKNMLKNNFVDTSNLFKEKGLTFFWEGKYDNDNMNNRDTITTDLNVFETFNPELTDLGLDEKATKLDVRYMVEGTLWKMHDIFQLSVELYDFKESKVIWLDRWQEKWDNLPSIKGSLSDGLLKALSTKPNEIKKSDNINTQAYEVYLEGKYRSQKTENLEDKKIAQELLQKAIALDNNLIDAKLWLAWSHIHINENDKAQF